MAYPRIKAVIFNHNQPATSERLLTLLSSCFDSALFDSGSDPEQHSSLTTHSFDNLFWTGCWNKAWQTFPDYDVIWGIGGDVSLLSPVELYAESIAAAYPFGLWSPAIEGNAQTYMKAPVGLHALFSVHRLEGVAFAISRTAWQAVGPLDEENSFGFGQDLVCSYESRRHGYKNLLDTRVCIQHPMTQSYNREKAKDLMFAAFEKRYGPDWNDCLDFWWGNRISFSKNVISRVEVEAPGLKRYTMPFA